MATETPEAVPVTVVISLPEAPGKVSFPSALQSTVGDILDTLTLFPFTHQYTCFKLVADSKPELDLEQSFTISDIIGDSKTEEFKLSVKPLAYTEKSVREHLIKVRELTFLETSSLENSLHDFSGVSSGSTSFNKLNLGPVKPREEEEKKEAEAEVEVEAEAEKPKEESTKEPYVATEEEKAQLSQLAEALTTQLSVDSKFAAKSNVSLAPCLRSLYISSWTPAANSRALAGDLLYLQCQTLEGETFNITAHVSGFFVNNSSVARFDASPKQVLAPNGKSRVSRCHSLLTLLKELSPKLQEQLNENSNILKDLTTESVALPTTCFLANPWYVDLNAVAKKQPDLARSQSNFIQGGLNGADLQKDWNSELQAFRELSVENEDETLVQERLLTKQSFEFTTAAVQGAISVLRGDITPMNPEDSKADQIFYHNSIFYSFGDASQFGGNIEAARAAASRDLIGVKCLNRLNVKGVYHLATTIVDYCGKRVICQIPVPGILNQAPPMEDEEGVETPATSAVVYGSAEDNTVLSADESFSKAFAPIAEAFHLKKHTAWLEDGSKSAELVTSFNTKGIKGTDGRKYIIDLYRATPLDIDFINKHYDESKETSYPHKETTLRLEAVDKWYTRQVSVAVKAEADRLEKENPGSSKETEGSEKPELNIDLSQFALNPDAFTLSYDNAPSPEALASLKEDENVVLEASKFVSTVLVPEYIDQISKNDTTIPVDGAQLSSSLHSYGISLRYLGLVAQKVLISKEAYLTARKAALADIAKANEQFKAEQAEKEKEKAKKAEENKDKEEAEKEKEEEKEEEDTKQPSKIDTTPYINILETLYIIIVNEMIARGTKHFLRQSTSSLPLPLVPHVIAHVHNCLIGSGASVSIDEYVKDIYPDADLSVLDLTKEQVQAGIAAEVFKRFRFELPADYAASIKPLPMLRRIAQKFGIQWKSSDYAFSAEQLDAKIAAFKASVARAEEVKKSSNSKRHNDKHIETESLSVAPSATFTAEDIVNIVPVIKDSIFTSLTTDRFMEIATKSIAEGNIDTALMYVKGAASISESLYGLIHPSVANAYNTLSQFYYDVGLYPEASEAARKAFQIYERTKGIDSYESNVSMSRIAFSEAENSSPVNSFIAYKHMIDQVEMITGSRTHPNYITSLTSIASTLQQQKLFKEAIVVFEYILSLIPTSNDPQLVAVLNFQICNAYLALPQPNLKKAQEHISIAVDIFETELGVQDASYIQAKKTSEQLTLYSAYLKQQQKAEAAAGKKKVSSVQTAAPTAANGSTKSKKKTPVPNAELAKKSVDELMMFIEGKTGSGKKNKKKGKK